MDVEHVIACCQDEEETAVAKDKTEWTFEVDIKAPQPAHLDGEQWKNVATGTGIHEVVAPETLPKGLSWPRVSSLGRYQDCHSVITEPILCARRHACIKLFGHSYSFHGLVARAFLGRVPDGHTVDHIDSNASNNNLTNLRYITHSDCLRKSQASGTRKSNASKRSKPVIATPIDDEGKKGEAQRFVSVNEAARDLKINLAQISKYCRAGDDDKIYKVRKTKRKWSFCFDADASEPLDGEIWRDVVF